MQRFTQGSMWIFLGVSNGVSRARWVKLANRRAGHLSSLPLFAPGGAQRASCSARRVELGRHAEAFRRRPCRFLAAKIA
ncbi:hypothetical protein DB384_08730 [Pseudomonas aeruginosa]|nr:hypothetical protein EGV94_06285 [Pseudomonas aeruginosa]MCO3349005.1 hypothetical protein [Pseudomonas aeruginosa]PTZ03650.1 hypothetical protein DB384_08730 [Pseudomonas aeruginosa]RTC16798.1 hypothetical protein EJ653_02675 [Pseudomonas aeruginosa]TEC35874.1 hypothetical protein IPC1595_07650 [Pseudomonas aeruginosa]